jgi:hypothetical protein
MKEASGTRFLQIEVRRNRTGAGDLAVLLSRQFL